MKSNSHNQSGFTLVEIMIVVLIIGLLAAIGLPAIASVSAKGKAASFTQSLKTFAHAAESYTLINGDYPVDASTNSLPAGMAGYIIREKFENGTPLGGFWDFEAYDSGITSGVGVVSPTASLAELQLIDQNIDDGNLATGSFRQVAVGRYYWVIEN